MNPQKKVSSKTPFKHLFSPLETGKLKLKNRIVMLGTTLHYTESVELDDRSIEFLATRARGGAGLIITGTFAVTEVAGGRGVPHIDDDRYIPQLQKLTAAVHQANGKIAAQLGHQGRYVHSDEIGGKQPHSASAAMSAHWGKDIPKEMTIEDIKATVAGFGKAAGRAKTAGFDAVEILGSQGYLINQFLSPASNQRKDEYGGSYENRLRFPLEVIRAVRKEVGEDFPIIMRLCAAEFVPGGLGIEDTKKIAVIYEQNGIDVLDLQVAWHESSVPSVYMVVPRGAFTYLARAIKNTVKIPVIAVNRINDPLLAERILKEGIADLVGMSRALIADPDLPNKAQADQLDEICPCVGCVEGCLAFMKGERLPVRCLANPRAGREKEISLAPAAKPKKVVVVGGGPAGLESALILAQRGHEVVLYEKSRKFGGDLRLASLVPDKYEFGNYINYLEHKVKKLGVKVNAGKKATAETVLAEKPQVVIIATGSNPTAPPVPGINGPNVFGFREVLDGSVELGEKVVVIGGGGVGCDVAIYAAHKGAPDAETLLYLLKTGAVTGEEAVKLDRGARKVVMVEMLEKIGMGIWGQVRWVVLQEVRRLGIEVLTKVKCQQITDKGVVIAQDGKERLIEADTVVVATGIKPENSLYAELQGKVPEVFVVGNANQVRDALAATGEVATIACRI